MAVAKMFKKTSEDDNALPDKLPRVKKEKYNKESYVSRKQQRTQQKENVKRGQKTLMEVNPSLKRRKAKRISQHANSPKSQFQHRASTAITDASAKRSIGMKVVDTSKDKKQPKGSGKEAAAESAFNAYLKRAEQRDKALGIKIKKQK